MEAGIWSGQWGPPQKHHGLIEEIGNYLSQPGELFGNIGDDLP